MNNVYKFPLDNDPLWADFREKLDTALRKQNFTELFRQELLRRMKAVFQMHQFQYELIIPSLSTKAHEVNLKIEKLNHAIQNHIQNLLMARLTTEIKVMQLEGFH